MPSAKVVVDDRFRSLGREYEQGVQRALGHAAAAGIAAARSAGSEYDIAAIKASVKATPVHRAKRGWRTFIYTEDFRGVFFERGTYSRRRGKLSPRYHRTPRAERIAAEAGTGVKPQRFMLAALRAARTVLIREVERELR